MNAQRPDLKKDITVTLITYEKTTNDTVRFSIIEVFSGSNRIKTSVSDFDGIGVFKIKVKDIFDENIRLKVHGPKCVIFEKKYEIKDDLKIEIPLKYGKTEYVDFTELHIMQSKLNIKPVFSEELECGFEDQPVYRKN
ncbi:hypothetical protein SAMN05444148_0153 [Winogradskyella jejuensis]|uniref:Uncharacterized protein n=1 Tax=Winogradskyella jejuensis TaxID=1089305 RepID=A0A1M5JUY0_9FLAO|nr:hypothetical protein SAMN05444148_0153 [Winogradskyella jejuensis]